MEKEGVQVQSQEDVHRHQKQKMEESRVGIRIIHAVSHVMFCKTTPSVNIIVL